MERGENGNAGLTGDIGNFGIFMWHWRGSRSICADCKPWYGAAHSRQNKCGGVCSCAGKWSDLWRNLRMRSGNFSGYSISGRNLVPGLIWSCFRPVPGMSVGGAGRSPECLSGTVSSCWLKAGTWYFDYRVCSRKDHWGTGVFPVDCTLITDCLQGNKK